MKLTIDLYDPSQRADALNILSLFDEVDPQEVDQFPEPVAEAEPVVEAPAADPVDLGIDKPAVKPVVPKVSLDPAAPAEKTEAVSAVQVQELAMELNKSGKIDRDGLVTRLASYGGAARISALEPEALAAFYAELQTLKGDENV